MQLSVFLGNIVCLLVLPAVAFGALVSVENEDDKTVEPSVYVHCLNELPKTLTLPKGAPETMRLLIPKGESVIDYEPLIAGKGWGASIKYHSAYCDVAIYVYDKNKAVLTKQDAKQEQADFDGFVAESVFEKEVGDYVFYGKAGIAPLDNPINKQVQMFSVAAVHNMFIKYRTVCRHIVDIPADANYKIADSMVSQVMKETLVLLDRCLTTSETK